MKTVSISEAKAHLSRLIEGAANGEPFVITKAGRPMVQVVAVDPPTPGAKRRLGFMEGEMTIPDDFKAFGRVEIEKLFYGDE